ncbi:hypothetical protein SANTM175S_04567 [Streptomyces antimycoticus]
MARLASLMSRTFDTRPAGVGPRALLAAVRCRRRAASAFCSASLPLRRACWLSRSAFSAIVR